MEPNPYEAPRRATEPQAASNADDHDPIFKVATFTVVAMSWLVMAAVVAGLVAALVIYFG
jgi:hypothetical protein